MKNETSGKEIKKDLIRIANNIDGEHLSRRLTEEDLSEKEFKCKYCGQKFSSKEKVDKHQRTCV